MARQRRAVDTIFYRNWWWIGGNNPQKQRQVKTTAPNRYDQDGFVDALYALTLSKSVKLATCCCCPVKMTILRLRCYSFCLKPESKDLIHIFRGSTLASPVY